jgi:hypothetical protein
MKHPLSRHRSCEGSEVAAMRTAWTDDRFSDGQGHLSHAEVLLRSACSMLSGGSQDLASALSVSLPVDGRQTPEELVELSMDLAAEYGLMARAAVGERHVNVRLAQTPGDSARSAAGNGPNDPLRGLARAPIVALGVDARTTNGKANWLETIGSEAND